MLDSLPKRMRVPKKHALTFTSMLLPTLGVTLEYHRRRYYLDRDA